MTPAVREVTPWRSPATHPLACPSCANTARPQRTRQESTRPAQPSAPTPRRQNWLRSLKFSVTLSSLSPTPARKPSASNWLRSVKLFSRESPASLTPPPAEPAKLASFRQNQTKPSGAAAAPPPAPRSAPPGPFSAPHVKLPLYAIPPRRATSSPPLAPGPLLIPPPAVSSFRKDARPIKAGFFIANSMNLIRILGTNQVGRLLARKAARFYEAEAIVAPILEAVRKRGDKGLVEYARRSSTTWSANPSASPSANSRPPPRSFTPDFRAAVDTRLRQRPRLRPAPDARRMVEGVQTRPQARPDRPAPRYRRRLRPRRPLSRCPHSIMTAVPAQVAGVKTSASPAPKPSTEVFGTCAPPRRRQRLPDGRRAGHRRLRLRHQHRPQSRPHRRPRQHLRRRRQEAPRRRGRHRLHRRPHRDPHHRRRWRSARHRRRSCSPKPSTIPTPAPSC